MRSMTESQKLAADIEGVYKQFMWLPNEHSYTVPTLWVLHSSLRDGEGMHLPYITGRLGWFSKTPGCGKSLGMKLTAFMSANGKLLVNPTAPSLTMMMDRDRNTCGFDEFDKYMGKGNGNGPMFGIINAGYERGTVSTKVRNDEIVDEYLAGPIVLSGKNYTRFTTAENFDTIRSRTHVILTEKKPAIGSGVDNFQAELHTPRVKAIGTRVQKWGVTNAPAILAQDVTIPERIASRALDIWKNLFEIALFIDGGVKGEWWKRCESAARAFVLNEWAEDVHQVISSTDELLMEVRAAFDDEQTFIRSKDLLAHLMSIPGDVWWKREWKNPQAAAMGLARALKTFNIEHSREYVNGIQERGYSLADVTEDEAEAIVEEDTVNAIVDASGWDWSEIDD